MRNAELREFCRRGLTLLSHQATKANIKQEAARINRWFRDDKPYINWDPFDVFYITIFFFLFFSSYSFSFLKFIQRGYFRIFFLSQSTFEKRKGLRRDTVLQKFYHIKRSIRCKMRWRTSKMMNSCTKTSRLFCIILDMRNIKFHSGTHFKDIS